MYFLSDEAKEKLKLVSERLVNNGKGILAADESMATVGKRFDKISLENSEPNRQAFREMLFTAKGLNKFISGVILHEETLNQSTLSGTPFAKLLDEHGILVGIKVDQGLQIIEGTNGESTTLGLDTLAKRCVKYVDQGAKFAKWRCVIKISDLTPTELAVNEVAHNLSRYAVICQSNGLVPIVEPEVLFDGNHTIKQAQTITEHVLATVYKSLHDNKVYLEGTLIKPNMVTAGESCPEKCTPEIIAKATRETLLRTVPAAVTGIVFLSGGQSEISATVHLNEINKFSGKKPWAITFSFARALQNSAVDTWKGKPENVEAAHKILLHRAQMNSLASLGQYQISLEGENVKNAEKSLFVAGHTY